MKPIIAYVVICALTSLPPHLNASEGKELILNSGFEERPALSNWQLNPHAGPVQVVFSPDTSPFPTGGAYSSTAVLLTDTGGADVIGPLMQVFSPTGPQACFSFDFKVASFSDSLWYVLPGYTTKNGTATDTRFAVNLFLGRNGMFGFSDAASTGIFWHPLEQNVWYHLAIDFDFERGLSNGAVVPFGGEAFSWEARPFYSALPFNSIMFVNDLDPIRSGDLYLDNISLTSNVVPEPGAIAAFALFAVLVLAVCQRRWAIAGSRLRAGRNLLEPRSNVPRG